MKTAFLLFVSIVMSFCGIASGEEAPKSIQWGRARAMIPENPNFEKIDKGNPADWFENTGISPRGTCSIAGKTSSGRGTYLKFVTSSTQKYNLYSATSFAVEGGEKLLLSAMCRGKGKIRLEVYAYNQANQMIEYNEPKAQTINSNNWQRKSFDFKLPESGRISQGKLSIVKAVIVVEPDSRVYVDDFRGIISRSMSSTKPAEIVIGSNIDPSPGKKGEAPYEMSGRKQKREPLLDFADCSQWAVETFNCKAALYRSNEQFLPFREWSGKLVYRATGENPSVIVRPINPLTVSEDWDCIGLWNWGNVWAWKPDSNNPVLYCSALVKGADGIEHEIELGPMFYRYWFLSRSKVTENIKYPATFCGLRFSNCTNSTDQTVFLDSISFYKDSPEPLENMSDLPEKMPFPVREETILPSNIAEDFENTVRLSGSVVQLCYRGTDTEMNYSVDTSKRMFDGLMVSCKGENFYPCREMKVILANGKVADLKVLAKRASENGFEMAWGCSADELKTVLTAKVEIKQKSLIFTFKETGETGCISELDVGRAEEVKDFELIWIPFISYEWNKKFPHLLRSGKLFAFGHFDWYFSDGSLLQGANDKTVKWAKFNGSVSYVPKTDGKRNLLRERYFLTVSPNVEDVFPTIPNPPSPMRKEMAHRQWRVKGGVPYAAEVAEATRLRSLGLESVAIRYHEQLWRDAGESYTFKTEAAPKRGGNAALKQMITSVQALGWLAGTYTNYTDLAPVNRFWNENQLRLKSDGNWYSGWTRCYVPKSSFGRKMEAELAPQIQQQIGERHSYCDVLTAVPPFMWVDFDARIPGAGKFRTAFENSGLILLNERKAHKGPVFSEGGCHWFYAGLADGNYGQMFAPGGRRPPSVQLFPDFDLYKIHPLEMNAGMGDTGMFFRAGSEKNFQQFLATTLAYGHIGYLSGSESEMMQMYYMLQPLQEHYIMIPVKHIAYDCGGKMLNTSAALVDGRWRDSRLHVVYENGFRVWVNGSGKDWAVEDDVFGKNVLPPWGFLAGTADGKVYSKSVYFDSDRNSADSGKRNWLKLTRSPNACYFDTSDKMVSTPLFVGDGAVALKKEYSGWEIIPARDFRQFAFSPETFGFSKNKICISELDDLGRRIGPAKMKLEAGKIWLESQPRSRAFKFRIEEKKEI